LQGARRRQTLSARGLPHCCSTRQAALSRAWWRQALPARGLHQGSSRRHRALQGARRRQALPRGGLYQVRPRRYRALQGARGRQALSAPGLPQGGSDRRHASLHGAWRGQALPEGGLHQGSRSSSRQCVLQAMPPARAARRCAGRCIATVWRGPGALNHGWDRGARARTSTGRVESAGQPTG
jgi:hypothetical protein